MKPFHFHTRYFKLGPFRVQFTLSHINGPLWNGQPSELATPFQWKPQFYKFKQEFCGFITVSRGVVIGLLSATIDICDVRVTP